MDASIKKLKELIDQAGLLNHKLIHALEIQDENQAEKALDIYASWKGKSIILLRQLESNEYHIFADHDNVADLSHLLTTEEDPHIGKIRSRYKDDSEKPISQDTGNQMISALAGLKERKNALVRELQKQTAPIEKTTTVHISYNINIGKFIFNGIATVELEGKQKDTADYLVNAGKEVKVCWDEIHDTFKDLVTDQDKPNVTEGDAQKRSVRTAVNEINKHTQKYLQNGALIDAKNNYYWLQYEVDKGR